MTGKLAGMSTYQQGFSGGLSIRDMKLDINHPGKVFWVGDGDTAGNTVAYPNRKTPSNGNKGTFLAPFATIDYAVSQCRADAGDLIYVLPGHVEDVAAAGDIDLDVDGISVIGLGKGDKMPLIGFTAAAATVEVNADNVYVEGLRFQAQAAEVLEGLSILDGADDYHVKGCRFDTATLGTHEFHDALVVTTADRGVIEDCYFDMDESASTDADSAIHFVGACLGGTVRNNYITGDYAVACIESISAAQEQLVIEGNTLINGVHSGLNTVAAIVLLTGTTGLLQNNNLYTNVAAAVTGAVTADGMFLGGGNWVSTSAETAPIALEGGSLSPIVQTTVNDSVADGTTGLGLFTVTGNVYIHGFRLHAEVGADSATTAGIALDATTAAFDTTFVALTDLATASTAGDFAVALTAGGGWTIRQVEDTTENAQLWNTAVVCPPGQIEWLESGGAAGALTSSITIYWSEATAGAAVAVV